MNQWEDPEDVENLADLPLEHLLRLQGRLNRQAEAVDREVRRRMPGMARHNAEMDLRSMSDEKRAAMDAEIERALKGLPPSPAPAAKKTTRPRKGDK